jgi:NADH-quinone oxidoreductase subunit H
MDAVLALELAYWQQTLIKVLVVLVVVPTSTAIIVQTFLFKTMAHMQSRLGPMEAGPHGSLQLLADGGKFVQKELLAPAQADRRVFALAPLVVLVSTFLVFVVVPASPSGVGEALDTGVFYALAVSSISVIGILMAGRRPTSTRCSAASGPPASSSPTSCRSCSPSSGWPSRPRP